MKMLRQQQQQAAHRSTSCTSTGALCAGRTVNVESTELRGAIRTRALPVQSHRLYCLPSVGLTAVHSVADKMISVVS